MNTRQAKALLELLADLYLLASAPDPPPEPPPVPNGAAEKMQGAKTPTVT